MHGNYEPTQAEWDEQLREQEELRYEFGAGTPPCRTTRAPAPTAAPTAPSTTTQTKCRACERLFFLLDRETGLCNDDYAEWLRCKPQRDAWIARGRPLRRDLPRQHHPRVGLRFDDDLHNDMTERDFDPDIGDR